MANRYEHHHNIHKNHNQKSIFLPMFCRLSTKDVKLNNHHRSNQAPVAGEPSSPKVSCMGQVKRNNRVIGYPSAAAATNHHKHMIITKRNKTLFFSSKALLPNTTATMNAGTTAGGGIRGCGTRREITRVRNSRRSRVTIDFDDQDNNEDYCVEMVDIAEMDPPLPVVKRVAPPGGGRDEVNLWKRRFNGAGLKSLEIERVHLPDPTNFNRRRHN